MSIVEERHKNAPQRDTRVCVCLSINHEEGEKYFCGQDNQSRGGNIVRNSNYWMNFRDRGLCDLQSRSCLPNLYPQTLLVLSQVLCISVSNEKLNNIKESYLSS